MSTSTPTPTPESAERAWVAAMLLLDQRASERTPEGEPCDS
jgi:hypothetical protein